MCLGLKPHSYRPLNFLDWATPLNNLRPFPYLSPCQSTKNSHFGEKNVSWICENAQNSGNQRNFFFFWPHPASCGILVPQLGIEPTPLAVKAQTANHWTSREFPQRNFNWVMAYLAWDERMEFRRWEVPTDTEHSWRRQLWWCSVYTVWTPQEPSSGGSVGQETSTSHLPSA